jgi:hypothetical protein
MRASYITYQLRPGQIAPPCLSSPLPSSLSPPPRPLAAGFPALHPVLSSPLDKSHRQVGVPHLGPMEVRASVPPSHPTTPHAHAPTPLDRPATMHRPRHAPTDSLPPEPRVSATRRAGRSGKREAGSAITRRTSQPSHWPAPKHPSPPWKAATSPRPRARSNEAPTRILHLHMLAAKGTTTSAPYLSCLRAAWPPCAATRSRPILADPE